MRLVCTGESAGYFRGETLAVGESSADKADGWATSQCRALNFPPRTSQLCQVCPWCQKSITHPRSFTRHMQKCQGLKYFACTICGYQTHRSDHYWLHMGRLHNVIRSRKTAAKFWRERMCVCERERLRERERERLFHIWRERMAKRVFFVPTAKSYSGCVQVDQVVFKSGSDLMDQNL